MGVRQSEWANRKRGRRPAGAADGQPIRRGAAGLLAVLRAPHLAPGLLASAVVLAGLLGGWSYARREAERDVYTQAPLESAAKTHSLVLEDQAFRRPDLLPWYGASELALPRQYNARTFFSSFPTGFAVYSAAWGGGSPLLYLEKLAAIGPDLRGRKLVISLDPGEFVQPRPDPKQYAGNFSHLAAAELIWSPDVDRPIKQAAAQRMLLYPDTLRDHPLLRFATRNLADRSPLGQALYLATVPLGRLHLAVVWLQNEADTLRLLLGGHFPALRPRQAVTPQWAAIAARADRAQRARATNNPLGMDEEAWAAQRAQLQQRRGAWTDASFRAALDRSSQWQDLELLLRALKELGAQPLLVSMPIDGRLYAWEGISPAGRQRYYQKLTDLAGRYGVPLETFRDHDEDPYFFYDWVHPSPKGWIIIDRAVDGFYHDSGPPRS